MIYSTSQLASITGSLLKGEHDIIVKNIAFDSRMVYDVTDTAFIAIRTERNSGEKYIADVVDKGIRVIISQAVVPGCDATWIIVKDTVEFLHKLAKYHLTQLNHLTTIGITGSNGKTIVKEWLYQALAPDSSVVKSPKSFNSQYGLPLSVLHAENHHRTGVFEAGISHPGEMQKLYEILHPEIGIFTHLGSAHLSNFDSKTQLLNEKLKLFQNAKVIFYNGDDELVADSIARLYHNKKLVSFGLKSHNDIHPAHPTDSPVPIQVNCFGDIIHLTPERRDAAALSNLLCVIAVLNYLGIDSDKISSRVKGLIGVEMRMESVSGINGNLIINDSYNLDLDSLIIAFERLQEYRKREKVLVLTDFAEIKNPGTFYPGIMQQINAQDFAKVFLVGNIITQYQHLLAHQSATFKTIKALIASQTFNKINDAVILIKGARAFHAEDLKKHLQLQKHDTVLEVNLNALLHNINVHKTFLKPETKMMAMVKAHSYGTGGYEIAEFLQHHHLDYLGVAYADEGVELRRKGITLPIMVMNPEQSSYDVIIDYQLEPEIYSFRVLDLFMKQLTAKGIQDPYPIHLKLETGMHRLGFTPKATTDLVQQIKGSKVVVRSMFSHLSVADTEGETEYTLQQISLFEKFSDEIIKGLGYKPLRHILNSAGITNYTEFQYDMVRIGIGMYGISSNEEVKPRLRPVVSFKTVISQISELEPGETLGYGRRFTADSKLRFATIPVGYADGIPRAIGNGVGKVGVSGKLVPILGSVCMDMIMIGIGNLPVKEGDEVTIFNGAPSMEEYAAFAGTIPYESLTSVSRRVKRIYIKD